jgi:hypothetical protein
MQPERRMAAAGAGRSAQRAEQPDHRQQPHRCLEQQEGGDERRSHYRVGRRLSHKPLQNPVARQAMGQGPTSHANRPSRWDDAFNAIRFRPLNPTATRSTLWGGFTRQPRRIRAASGIRSGTSGNALSRTHSRPTSAVIFSGRWPEFFSAIWPAAGRSRPGHTSGFVDDLHYVFGQLVAKEGSS